MMKITALISFIAGMSALVVSELIFSKAVPGGVELHYTDLAAREDNEATAAEQSSRVARHELAEASTGDEAAEHWLQRHDQSLRAVQSYSALADLHRKQQYENSTIALNERLKRIERRTICRRLSGFFFAVAAIALLVFLTGNKSRTQGNTATA